MNSAELTALLNEDRAEKRTARLMANITRRASRLFDDGYTATKNMNGLYAQMYQVVSPEGQRYSVKISQTPALPGTFYGSRCTCPCFTEHKTCKHLQGVELMLAQEDAQEAEYEARQDNDDDPYARF